MFDRFCLHIDFEIFGMPTGGSLKLGKLFDVIFSIFFSTNQILVFVSANYRYDNYPEGFFSFFPRSTPFGFKTDSIEK